MKAYIYSDGATHPVTLNEGMAVSFKLKVGRNLTDVPEATLGKVGRRTIDATYRTLGGLRRNRLVTRTVPVLKRIRGGDGPTFKITDSVWGLSLFPQEGH